ncbi:unnamed protein product, partial [Rotaria sp. Silwood1]
PDEKRINHPLYKIYNNASETSSIISSGNDNGYHVINQEYIEDDFIQSSSTLNNQNETTEYIYKCSLCDYQSNITLNWAWMCVGCGC